MRGGRRGKRRSVFAVVMCLVAIIFSALVIARMESENRSAEVSPISSVKPAVNERETPGRYDGIKLAPEDIELLAEIAYWEARGQSAAGQQAVVEVVLNRVLADNFPDTVREVIYEPRQFAPVKKIPGAEPAQAQYDAVNAALHGENIIPLDVVYFSAKGENSRVWGRIQDHVFCYQYVWE